MPRTTTRKTSLNWVLFGMVLAGIPASAQNAIVNSDFDDGTAGWGFYNLTGTGWSDTEGDPHPGAMALVSPGGCDCTTWAYECVEVSPATPYSISYHVKKANGSNNAPILLGYLDWYSGTNCTEGISIDLYFDYLTFGSLPEGSWELRQRGTLTSYAEAHSARFWVGFDHPGAGLATLYVDSIALAGPIVFVDDFETESTDLWSEVVP